MVTRTIHRGHPSEAFFFFFASLIYCYFQLFYLTSKVCTKYIGRLFFAFQGAAPFLWNKLPRSAREATIF